MLDAAHGQFAAVLKYVAWKLGKSLLFVDQKGTSQHSGIASTNSLKNYRSDGIIVTAENLWFEMKTQPNLSKRLA
jgi:hypothetical protein